MVGAEQGLAELVHNPGAAQLGKRIRGRHRRDDRAVGKRIARPMMIGHHDLEPTRLRTGDLVHGGDPAVDCQDETHSLLGKPAEGLARHSIALLEAARQVPADVCSELAQNENRKRSRADAVDVVIPVYADANTAIDTRANPFDGGRHVTEEQRIMPRQLGIQKPTCLMWLVVSTAYEHGRSDVAQPELTRDHDASLSVVGSDRPSARHATDGTDAAGQPVLVRNTGIR